jgi:hypothetical protein
MKKLNQYNSIELSNLEKNEINGGDAFMHDLGYGFAWLLDHTYGSIDRYFKQFR